MFKVPELDDFLRTCASFHKEEDRAPAFLKAVRIIQEGNKVEGIFRLLKIWNRRWSIRFHDLDEQIRVAIEDLEGILGGLEGKSSLSVDLSEKSSKDNIRKAYNIMSQKDGIKKTGGTKALHLLNQDLFMMWDTRIREKYHKDWFRENHFRRHKFEGQDCYLEFMRNCQSFAGKLVEQEDEEKIVERHLQDIGEKWESSETLAKMIDEYNYTIIRLS